MMAEECGKCKGKIKQNLIQCEGICKRKFHPECVDLDIEEVHLIRKNNNIKWFCDSCIFYLDSTTNMKKEMDNLRNVVNDKLEDFGNILASSERKENSITVKKKSYADAVGEVVLIKPKTKQESKTTKEAIRKAFNPAKLEVGITQIRDTREGGVLIKCKSKEEVEKIKSAAEKKLKKSYEIKTPEQKNPRIKIVDLEEALDKEVLEDAILKQNSFLNHDDVLLDIKVVRKMKSRYMAIAECDPLTSYKILNHGKLSIGWSICRVFEYIPVFRCFNCGDYDHKASECQRDEKCLKCASKDHKTDSCESDHYNCCNCIAANDKLKLNLKTDHTVFDISCPVFLRKIDALKRKIKVVPDSNK